MIQPEVHHACQTFGGAHHCSLGDTLHNSVEHLQKRAASRALQIGRVRANGNIEHRANGLSAKDIST